MSSENLRPQSKVALDTARKQSGLHTAGHSYVVLAENFQSEDIPVWILVSLRCGKSVVVPQFVIVR